MKPKVLRFQTKLILIQIFLVLPILALVLFVSIYWIRSSAIEAIYNSRNDSLQTAAAAFDRIYNRMIKLLEKPYTDQELYQIISSEYTPDDVAVKNGNDQKANRLLNNILYYEPDISSITLVLDATDCFYYKRRSPSVAVNVHNPDWYHPTGSSWYQSAMQHDDYIVTPTAIDELFLNSGPTIAIFQRLLNVNNAQKIGVFRIDIGLENFYSGWERIVQDPEQEILMVLDSHKQLVYCSSDQYLSTHPLLSIVHTADFSGEYHLNTFTASDSALQFVYLSREMGLLNIKQPLYLTGLLLIAFYLFYAVLLIHWSSRYLSNPINKLKTAMVLGRGDDLDARCEPLTGEMGDLSDAFNALMERMGILIEDSTRHEQEKARLAYEILQSKINPHFLYNTLNAIRCKADMIGAAHISHALESLASLLRFTIKCTDELIPFETELAQLENYIQIMRIRYGDEIDFDFDIDDACFQYQCLKFLIQPMVENCFIHAFHFSKKRQNTVTVRISCEDSYILIVVEDNGDGMTGEQIADVFSTQSPESKTNFFGIGIPSVKQHIEVLFKEPYTLWIESCPHCYTKVYASIPKMEVVQ